MSSARLCAAVALTTALTGCASPSTSSEAVPTPSVGTSAPSSSSVRPPSPSASAVGPAAGEGTALAALAALAVKGRAPQTGYDRDLFGPAWADVDRNGCDTRNDILARDLTDETFRPGTRGCVVLTGTLAGPYTGQTIRFRKEDASAVQIDHVVALSDAWQKGAQQWDADKRLAFANDPLNLLAVDGSTNSSKSDADAASWLPPNKSFRCAMVARQMAVKAKYELWVTAAERDAIGRVLAGCPNEPLPQDYAAPTGVAVPQQQRREPAPATTAPPARGGGTDPNYGTCKEAKANGAGPYTEGEDPEYAYYRDGDSDGMVCE